MTTSKCSCAVSGLCHLSHSSLFGRLSLPLVFHVSSLHIGHTSRALFPHWSHILVIVHSSCHPLCTFAPAINMSDTFACLFLFLLTLPLHEVTIPLFFFPHFPFFTFYPTTSVFLIFLILFVCLFCFWQQQVGIDQGDIPDLSQVSVHLTFHVLFFLLQTLSLFLASLSPIGCFSPTLCSISLPFFLPLLLYTLFPPQSKPCFASYANLSSHSVLFTRCLLIFVSTNCLLQPELTAGGSPPLWLISCFVFCF